MKILLSAYACEPNCGSEPGVGWNIAWELAKYHEVWVLTRESNQSKILDFQSQHLNPSIRFIYCEPPGLMKYLKPAQIPHYYCWQLGAYLSAKQLHQQEQFDIVHHVTYVRYSTPSFLSLLPVPFIWGPVGGGEQAPQPFWEDFDLRARLYEKARFIVHRIGELDPFTRMTAQHSALVRATTQETAERLHQLGAQHIEIYGESGLSLAEMEELACFDLPTPLPFRLISMARLLHWKGLHLGIRAFAQANLSEDAEYWIAGAGPERQTLEALANSLGVGSRVKFLGRLPRNQTLEKLSEAHILVHPSLHDSGGWVCLEAMAAGRPVVCLDTGGPSTQVTDQTGIKVPVSNPEQVVQDLAQAITTLAQDTYLRHRMSQAGRQRVREQFSWEAKGQQLAKLYAEIVSQAQPHNRSLSCAS